MSLCDFSVIFLEKSFCWLNDPEIQYLTDTKPVTKMEQIEWYQGLNKRKDYKVYGVLFNQIPIGVCGIKHIAGGVGEYFGYIGEKDYWGGSGTQMMILIEEKAKTLGIKKLTLRVLKNNERAIALYEKMSYKVASIDSVYMNMIKEL